MCGLFGFADLEEGGVSPSSIDKGRSSLHTLTHRGPDQWNEDISGNVYLGHRRLSILDLSEEGRQPMVTSDGAIAITVNGEIYNHQDLRRELGEGLFKSTSDSEVVLHGYRAWGLEKLLEKIDGMYAIIIHDRAQKLLHLVRDRAGIKQLHYACLDGKLVYASELKAIAAFYQGTDFLRQDTEALYDFLTYRYIPAPKTIWKNVFKLEPGHALTLNLANKAQHKTRYWELPADPSPSRDLQGLIGQSVEEQMMADVPLGFFLSGGIDSSIVVAEAAAHHSDLHTFSIGYDIAAHDETGYADKIAAQFRTDHHRKILSVDDNADLISLMKGWYDEPFADTSALSTYHVCAFARQHVTVALSGDGGDELFGGYRWYDRHPRFRNLQGPLGHIGSGPKTMFSRGTSGLTWSLLSRLDLYSHFDFYEMYGLLLGGVSGPAKNAYREFLGIPEDYDDFWLFKKFDRPELGPRKRLQYIDFHTFLPDDILVKVDRVSMAVSLEVRPPFLSRDIMEYAFSLPEPRIYEDGLLKGILKSAYKDILPAEILHRPKKGFSIPLHKWMKGELRDQGTIEEIIFQSFVPEASDIATRHAA